jgi:hypothetical protein
MTIAGFNHVPSFSLVRISLMRIALMRITVALGLACAASLAAAPAGAQGTPEQRQACQPDAMRLCSEFIPDVERITACMAKSRLRLSAACRVYFAPSPKGKPKRPE